MKKNLLLVVIGVVILTLVGIIYLQYKDSATEKIQPTESTTTWLTYTNTAFGYHINYPSNWSFREFPDTHTGAGFQPLSSPKDVASECIVIDARGTAENEYNAVFNDYVKTAATIEMQNYLKLNSMESTTTSSGLTGYMTTWLYKTMNGQEKTSLPITYFDYKKTVQTSVGQLRFKTIQLTLENNICEKTYLEMLPTFQILR